MNRKVNHRWVWLMVLAWIGSMLVSPRLALSMSLEDEIKKGQEATVEVEKESKVVTDPEINKRVNTIGQAIAAVCDETRFKYTFKILDDKDVNAFSLPGGFVYVNKGLLDQIQSDHELAGVLAHEIAHAAHHHMVQILQKQSRMDKWMTVLNVAAIAVLMSGKGGGEGVFNILTTVELVRIARLTGLGREAEYDADAAAIKYLKKTEYNPVGMLTFMSRLAREASLRPEVDYGIYQTHPISSDRVARIEGYLKEMAIPINTRVVLNVKSSVKSYQEEGREIGEVYFQDKLIFKTIPAQANRISENINRLLWDNLRIWEIRLDKTKNMVIARGEPLIIPTQEDSVLNNLPVSTLAAKSFNSLQRAMWSEELKNR